MADERDDFRLKATLPAPARPDLRPARPVSPVKPRAEAAATYERVEHPPPRATDAQHVLVRQVMSHPVHTLDVSAKLGAAWDLMEQQDIRHVPITEAHLLVGQLTRTDLARRLTESRGWRDEPVVDLMVRDVVTVGPNDSLRDASRLIIGSRHAGLPVVAPPGRPVGFLSARDVLQVLVRRAPLTLWV